MKSAPISSPALRPRIKPARISSDRRRARVMPCSTCRAISPRGSRGPAFSRSRISGFCTYAEPERFFSFRRTTHRAEPDYGRHITAIALAGE